MNKSKKDSPAWTREAPKVAGWYCQWSEGWRGHHDLKPEFIQVYEHTLEGPFGDQWWWLGPFNFDAPAPRKEAREWWLKTYRKDGEDHAYLIQTSAPKNMRGEEIKKGWVHVREVRESDTSGEAQLARNVLETYVPINGLGRKGMPLWDLAHLVTSAQEAERDTLKAKVESLEAKLRALEGAVRGVTQADGMIQGPVVGAIQHLSQTIKATLSHPKGEGQEARTRKDRERFLGKLVAIRMECGNAVGGAKRRQFDQGAKWLGLRIQKLIREVGEVQGEPTSPGGEKE